MINWDRVDELREEIGAEDFAEVSEIFLEEVDETIQSLPDLTDQAAFQSALHFLKGSAINLGFDKLSDACGVGEIEAKQNCFDPAQIPPLISLYSASKQEFLEKTA